MPRGHVAATARAEGFYDEFEGLQQLRHRAGLSDKWQLAELPKRLKKLLGIDRDTDEAMQSGFDRLADIVGTCPPKDRELLELSFNMYGYFADSLWTNRTDTFAETCTWCNSGRTVRHEADLALLRLLRRELSVLNETVEQHTELSAVDTASLAGGRAVEVTTSQKAYKVRILPAEGGASTIDRIPKRISVVFKDPQTVTEIAAQRFGPGSSSVHHYVQEHDERRRLFFAALDEGRRCREIYNMSELVTYARSRQHGINVELSPDSMSRTVALWLQAIEQYDAYSVGLTEDPLPFKYEIVDASLVVLHEAVGVSDSHRLNGIFIRDSEVAEQFQADFDIVWDRIAAQMRSQRGVIDWIHRNLLPELQPSLKF